jgi:drug/metabolite transporter (DMT)-like permease
MGGGEWGLLLALSLVWGGSFFFYKVLVQALPPFTVVLGRMAIAAVALNLWLAIRRQRLPLSPRLWLEFIALGVLNNALPFACFAYSEIRLSSGQAAILNATTPVFAILVGLMLRTGAPFTALRGMAVAFGFLGVIVLIGPSALRGGRDLPSELACLVASVSYAFGGYYARRFSYLGPLKVAAAQTTGAALATLPLALAVDHIWRLPMPAPAVWGALLGIGLVCTALAYLMFFRLLDRIDPTNVMLVTFLSPVSAMALGLVFLHEPIKPEAYGGMVMIGLSLMAIDGRVPARVRRAFRGQP